MPSLHGKAAYLLVRRMLLVWAIEVVALWVLAFALPGLHVAGWKSAALAIVVIALLNALVRPVLLLLTMPFTVLSFGFLTLALNAIILILAGHTVPGLTISGFGMALVTALGLAAITTAIVSVLSLNDDDSVYRNIVRRLATWSSGGTADEEIPGIIFLEIDGLSRRALDRALSSGQMPTLAKWIAEGSHRLETWDCGTPSQTSSSQAALLYGDSFDIPGFRWYDKGRGVMVVSSHPADAMEIEARLDAGKGLLAGGLSICNMLSGGAELSVATMSTYPRRSVRAASPAYFVYYLNPYNFVRALVLMIWEITVEYGEALYQRVRNVRPRVSRAGSFPLLRAVSTVLQHDLSTYLLMGGMFSGTPAAYTTFVGYDVVAHHAGAESRDAFRVLRNIDRRIRSIERAAQESRRRYRVVVLSDHGHTASVPFRQLFGDTIDSVVRTLVDRRNVHVAVAKGEGWDHVNALLTEAIQHDRFSARAARRLLRTRTEDGAVRLGDRGIAKKSAGFPDVVVCASGNLAHVYLLESAQRMPMEQIAVAHPGLIAGLVAHDGVGFVLVRSTAHGDIAIGKVGVHYLADSRVEGEDPLSPYGAGAPAHLRRLSTFPRCGDIVLNGRFDPSAQVVVSFEEQVSSHGGLGGAQAEPFVLFPAALELAAIERADAVGLHAALMRWRYAAPAPQKQ